MPARLKTARRQFLAAALALTTAALAGLAAAQERVKLIIGYQDLTVPSTVTAS